MTSKERWKTMRACWMRGHRRVAASMGGGTGRMGSRWPWLCPISTTEGGLKMATGPPHINNIQRDALSLHQCDTFLTPPPPQRGVWLLPIIDWKGDLDKEIYSSKWDRTKSGLRWRGMTRQTLLLVDYEWGCGVSEQLVWEITFSSLPALTSTRSVKSMYWIGAN